MIHMSNSSICINRKHIEKINLNEIGSKLHCINFIMLWLSHGNGLVLVILNSMYWCLCLNVFYYRPTCLPCVLQKCINHVPCHCFLLFLSVCVFIFSPTNLAPAVNSVIVAIFPVPRYGVLLLIILTEIIICAIFCWVRTPHATCMDSAEIVLSPSGFWLLIWTHCLSFHICFAAWRDEHVTLSFSITVLFTWHAVGQLSCSSHVWCVPSCMF